MNFDIAILIKKIKEANIEILEYLEKDLKEEDFSYSSFIGFGGDKSLNIDLIFEDIFIKHLNNFGNILSEEKGFIDNKQDITFIIDPLDGSNNFCSQLPYYGTSVAVKYKDKDIAGFVCNLVNKLLTYRVLDEDIRYFSFDKRLYLPSNNYDKVSKIAVFERAYKYPKIVQLLNERNIKFRVLGATALSLSRARDYKFVFFKGKLRSFDIDAGLFINKDLYLLRKEELLFLTKHKNIFDDFKELIKEF